MVNKLGNALLLAGALSVSQANAEQLNPGVDKTVEEGRTKTTAVLECEKLKTQLTSQELLEQCKADVSSKEIREYLISLGINPQELPGATIRERQYESGQFQDSISISELGLDGSDTFTVENIASKFEQILATINEKYSIQFTEGDWMERFAELSPNQDEVEVLNKFIALLPNEVKPVPLANALTGIIALKKYSEMDISTLSETEKVILNANVQAVLAVTSPELVENSLDIVLPAGLLINGEPLKSEKTYTSTAVNRDAVKQISEAGVELPIELVTEMDDIYKEYQIILASIKEKADAQTTPERTARFMKFHDQYKDSFEGMSTTSKLDMLQILATGDDEGSKLKGQKLLDKASEYVVLLDSEYSKENAVILTKYNNFIKKFNKSGENILSKILTERLGKDGVNYLNSEKIASLSSMSLEESEVSLKESEVSLKESEQLLQALLLLKEQSNLVAYNSN